MELRRALVKPCLHGTHHGGAHARSLQIGVHSDASNHDWLFIDKDARRADEATVQNCARMRALRVEPVNLRDGRDLLADDEHEIAQVHQIVHLARTQLIEVSDVDL